jgi:endonuclease/exonuclease/phosphatase (EEP) superfamily protein YafD
VVTGVSLVLAGLAWSMAGLNWCFDLIANLSAQWLLLSLVFGVWQIVRRRWWAAGLAGCACVLFAASMYVPRAAYRAGLKPTISVLTYNAHTRNTHPEEALGLILESGADVVALMEPSAALLDLIRESEPLRTIYPHRWIPDNARGGFRVVLTRWPQVGPGPRWAWRGGGARTGVEGMRVMRVDRPGGAFVLVLVQPESPRSPARWRQGNATLRFATEVVNDRLGTMDLPVVLAADLNGSPTGWRSRYLSKRTGLRRCKPWWVAGGTYPAQLVWPMRVAIDDVWVSEGVSVASWKIVGDGGSDHSAVLVELVF